MSGGAAHFAGAPARVSPSGPSDRPGRCEGRGQRAGGGECAGAARRRRSGRALARSPARFVNYRHIYHAGNVADVLKHAVLTRLLAYLQRKQTPFRVLDTHAGAGLYDLSSREAGRTGEWREGIGRLLAADLPPEAADLLEPYLALVRALNAAPAPDASCGALAGASSSIVAAAAAASLMPPPAGDGAETSRDVALARYPGSPLLVCALLRRQDRLSAIELQPDEHARLARLLAVDRRVRITRLDGWLALRAHVPPKERRGLVLVDPPFEAPGEFDRLVDGLVAAHRRFAHGVYVLWYPVKDGAPVGAFHARLAGCGVPRILCAELEVRRPVPGGGLAGSGLVIVNPPFTLADELAVLLPVLHRTLAREEGTAHRLFWLRGEE